MKTAELVEFLREVVKISEAHQHEEYASEESFDRIWPRVVQLKNLSTACRDVYRYWRQLGLGDKDEAV